MIPDTRESASGCPEVRSAGTGPFGRRAGVSLSTILFGLPALIRTSAICLGCHQKPSCTPFFTGGVIPPLPMRHRICGDRCRQEVPEGAWLFRKREVSRHAAGIIAKPWLITPSGSWASRYLQKVSQGMRGRDFCCHRNTKLRYRVRVCASAVTRCPVDEGFTGRLPACPSAAVQVDPKRLGRGTHRIPAAT